MLSNRDRRVLAHLGIPRHTEDLAQTLRVDPHSPTLAGDVLNDKLKDDLMARGLVTRLGQFSDPAKAAGVSQSKKSALSMPDEQAEVYSRRLLAPHHRWRLDGDLWALTNEGLDALKDPGDDEPAPMTASQVQATIDAEWQRVEHDFKPGETTLAGKLLVQEYTLWANAVADDCEGRWNVRPVLPMSGGSQFSDAYENLLLDAENQKTALGAIVDPWFMALVIVALTDADTGTTVEDATRKPTYTGYARKSVAGTDMPAASGTGGSVANTAAIIFAACTAGTSTIIGFGHCSAVTVGTLRKFGTCASTVVSTTQTPAQFAIGAYTTTIA